MGSIGKKLGGAAGRMISDIDRVPVDPETAEVAGEVAGEMVEASIITLAEKVTE